MRLRNSGVSKNRSQAVSIAAAPLPLALSMVTFEVLKMAVLNVLNEFKKKEDAITAQKGVPRIIKLIIYFERASF